MRGKNLASDSPALGEVGTIRIALSREAESRPSNQPSGHDRWLSYAKDRFKGHREAAKRRATIVLGMDPMEDIRRRLRVSNLEAKQELPEIERAGLLREINSSLTPQKRRDEALERRLALAEQCGEITKQLSSTGGN